jgi:CNT family concentrative nucleoside transporter
MNILQSLIGMVILLGIAYAMSTDRKKISLRIVGWGLGLQFMFAVLVLKTAPGRWLFDQLNDLVMALLGYTNAGSSFIFGSLLQTSLPVLKAGEEVGKADLGFIFAFQVLPTIIFFSSLMAVMYHIGIMQFLVSIVARVMFFTMKTSGAETLSAAGNIFVGQTEAPLLIKPFVDKMTMSELNAVMTGGFATVAGGVMAAYVGMLSGAFPDIAGHLIAASVMSAPAALVVAKIMLPETEVAATSGVLELTIEKVDVNVMDAAARGASEGMTLALNVAAMLLAFLALVAMINGFIGWTGGMLGFEALTLETIVGYLFWPLAWAMGVPAAECADIGRLLGLKTILNEFVAYGELVHVAPGLSHRSGVVATYALCGFANLGSIGIQLGGIGGIAPERRGDLARVAFRAMIAGTLAAFLTANIAGMLVG